MTINLLNKACIAHVTSESTPGRATLLTPQVTWASSVREAAIPQDGDVHRQR